MDNVRHLSLTSGLKRWYASVKIRNYLCVDHKFDTLQQTLKKVPACLDNK